MDTTGEHQPASATATLENQELVLSSDIESVAEIEQAVEAICGRAGFDEDTASNIAMVSREAAINAAKHGNEFASEKKITVNLQRTAATVRICIADQGAGLDPASLPDPLDPANLLRSSGRGVFLMRAIMDEVHFRQLEPGTEVTLIKRRDTEASS